MNAFLALVPFFYFLTRGSAIYNMVIFLRVSQSRISISPLEGFSHSAALNLLTSSRSSSPTGFLHLNCRSFSLFMNTTFPHSVLTKHSNILAIISFDCRESTHPPQSGLMRGTLSHYHSPLKIWNWRIGLRVTIVFSLVPAIRRVIGVNRRIVSLQAQTTFHPYLMGFHSFLRLEGSPTFTTQT